MDDQALRDHLHPHRMEAIGTLAAGLAHDMNNVLAAIIGIADILIEESDNTRIRTELEKIVGQAERGAELTRGLLAFSRKGQYRKQVIRVDEVVDKTLTLLGHTLPKTIELQRELGAAAACVDGDPVQLVQVLVNLGLNANEAMPGGGSLAIESSVCELGVQEAATHGLAAGRFVRICVADTGCGMDEATMRRAFEPFFTTKAAGQGTGLGLSLVWGVVKGHGGAIVVQSRRGHGSSFTIFLPACAPEVQPLPARQPRDVNPEAATILVVDDEAVLRTAMTRALERKGYKVVTACDGADGLRAFAQHRDRIGLVILDMGMPNMNGAECFRRLRAVSTVPVLVSTGYADDKQAQSLVGEGAALIEKPAPVAALLGEVARLLRTAA